MASIPGIPFQLNTPQLNIGQALSQGIKLADQPQTQANALLASMLANKIKGVEAQFAEPMANTNLALKQGELKYLPQIKQLEIALKNAQIQKALRGPQIQLNNLEKAIQGAERIKQTYGVNSNEYKQAQDYVNRISQGSNGISIATDPETGQQMIQIGGGGAGRGSKANPLYQTQDGEVISQPTPATVSNLQGRVIGVETVTPYINDIIEKMPQFQSLKTQAKGIGEGISNYVFGTNYKLPSEYASGKAAIKSASEGMLKQFGLNATGGNRDAMEAILTPIFGESEEGYRERVKNDLNKFIASKQFAGRTLGRGLSLGNPNQSNNQLAQSLENKKPIKIVSTVKKDGKIFYVDSNGDWYDADPNKDKKNG